MTIGQLISGIIIFFFILAMLRFLFPKIYKVVDAIYAVVLAAFILYWLFYGVHLISTRVLGAVW